METVVEWGIIFWLVTSVLTLIMSYISEKAFKTGNILIVECLKPLIIVMAIIAIISVSMLLVLQFLGYMDLTKPYPV